MADRPIRDLVEAMRGAASGEVEWRVQQPLDRSYCIAFRRKAWLDPERAAREWLAEHAKRYPSSPYASYEVAEVVVLDWRDKLMLEAADVLLELANAPEPDRT